ncbi:MAG: carboxypeptidase-like regulatory domain-containing protein [Bacteroidales bacterium]|nr:carboxypeptidase-like regulatory domain-containing protein [Bacteroidales bacterium]
MKLIYDKLQGRRFAIVSFAVLCLVLLPDFCSLASLMAQTSSGKSVTEVSGTVKDTDGNPLPGAGVLIKGTAEGTVTDSDGKWSMRVPENAVLEFSSLGFETAVAMADSRGGYWI